MGDFYIVLSDVLQYNTAPKVVDYKGPSTVYKFSRTSVYQWLNAFVYLLHEPFGDALTQNLNRQWMNANYPWEWVSVLLPKGVTLSAYALHLKGDAFSGIMI